MTIMDKSNNWESMREVILVAQRDHDKILGREGEGDNLDLFECFKITESVDVEEFVQTFCESVVSKFLEDQEWDKGNGCYEQDIVSCTRCRTTNMLWCEFINRMFDDWKEFLEAYVKAANRYFDGNVQSVTCLDDLLK